MVVAVIAQLSQAMASYRDVKNHHLEQWALGDAERTEKLALFRKERNARSESQQSPMSLLVQSPIAQYLGSISVSRE